MHTMNMMDTCMMLYEDDEFIMEVLRGLVAILVKEDIIIIHAQGFDEYILHALALQFFILFYVMTGSIISLEKPPQI